MMVVIFSNLSFMDFYRKIAPIYQVLGISPIFRPPSSKTETQSLHWTSTGIFGLILILYWSGIVASFVRQDLPNSTLSIISNNIQLLLNALALTTVIGNMLAKHRTYHRILDKFDSIDRQLSAIKQSVHYNGHVKLFYKLTVGFFVVLVYNYAFHLYVNLVRKQLQSVLYWILHSLPLFIYAFAIHQVAIFLYFCHCRLRIIKDLLDLAREEDEDQDSVAVQLIPVSQSSLRCTDYFDKVAMKKSRQIITDILGLCENINDFYGPVLLTTFFALFAVTSVQSFYCYVICADFDEESNRSVFTLFTCINLILINLSLVTFLVWASETVSKEATAIQLSVLKVKHISVGPLEGSLIGSYLMV